MSERGSFCTEYIYCDKCVEAVRSALFSFWRDKYWQPAQLSYQWGDSIRLLPIFAGKIGGTWTGSEIFYFNEDMLPEIESKICHQVIFAIIPDGGPVAEIILTPKEET